MNLSHILWYVYSFNAFNSAEEPDGVFISARQILYAFGLVCDLKYVYVTCSCYNMLNNNTLYLCSTFQVEI